MRDKSEKLHPALSSQKMAKWLMNFEAGPTGWLEGLGIKLNGFLERNFGRLLVWAYFLLVLSFSASVRAFILID